MTLTDRRECLAEHLARLQAGEINRAEFLALAVFEVEASMDENDGTEAEVLQRAFEMLQPALTVAHEVIEASPGCQGLLGLGDGVEI